MHADTLPFLRELTENNDRVWFQANKERYDVLRKSFAADVQALIDRIALFDPEIAGMEAKDCLYRIYRDIRFSPNKLPYKNYFSAYICKGGRKSLYGGYYFHVEPGNIILSGGIWMPEPKLLKKLRQDIYDQIDEFTAMLEYPPFKRIYPGLEGEMLTRMPAGFPADSPYGEILRHKDLSVISHNPDSFLQQPDWMDRAVEAYQLLLPFNRFLNYTVEEYLGQV